MTSANLAVEADVRLIGCQMTMDLFDYELADQMIGGIEVGGAATYIEVATQSHINLVHLDRVFSDGY